MRARWRATNESIGLAAQAASGGFGTLRAAGAPDVPASWRKSLGGDRNLFSYVVENDSQGHGEEESADAELDTD
jgi:hypothetical protein